MSRTAELLASAKPSLYPNYRQPDLVFGRGQGAELFDLEGKRYIDLFAGIAVSSLGHNHPRLTSAISQQAEQLLHLSNYYYNAPNLELAARLCRLTGMNAAMFCSSGTEAIEACLKLARRHFWAQGQAERVRVIAFEKAFHGRTLGALAATGQPSYQEGFGPLSPTTHVPYGDLDAVSKALGDDVCAILVEAVQGEGGVTPAPDGFLRGLRSLADESSVLLLADEVQTGVGRCGTFLGFQSYGVEPDALALAKGLGGGVPIGAMLCKEFLRGSLPPGSHGSTFGGSPLASAAANAVLDELEERELLSHVQRVSEQLADRLKSLAEKHSKHVERSRGLGLLQALVLRPGIDARQLTEVLRERGVLVTVAGGVALRFTPPLNIEAELLDEGLKIVDSVLGEL